jgi:hypothetical protein
MTFAKPGRATRAPNRSRGRPFFIAPRDKLILKYIWLWKIASSASIHEAVGRPKSVYSTYKVLAKLEAHELIECRFDLWEQFHVWQLTEKGFYEVKNYVGELKEDGYLSENHRHDRLVQAFQLGEWSTHQLQNLTFFTEQNLRRMDVVHYPQWLPPSNGHRPDGYTKIDGEKRPWVLAYEVELSAKHVQKYEGILEFYRHTKTVDQVLWLIGEKFIRDQILQAKSCIKETSSNYHLFVDLNDFLKNGWDAAIANERSENLGTLRDKYRGICGDFYGEILGRSRGNSRVTVHLNPRKVIGKTKT